MRSSRRALAWLFTVLTLTTACAELRVADTDAGGPDADDGGDESASSLQDGTTGKDVATDGGGPESHTPEILASGFTNPLEVVTLGDVVYFTLEHDPVASVRRVQKDAGGSAILAPFDAAAGQNPIANDLAIIGTEVVWANGTSGAGGVYAVPLTGGSVRKVKEPIDTPYHLAAYGGAAYFVDQAFSPSTYAIYRLPADGVTLPALVAPGQIRVGGIAVDSSGVYWTQGGPLASGKNGVRKSAPGSAADASTDLYVGTDNGEIGGIALGPTDVFWADTDSGRVLRVGKNGGVASVLADSLSVPMRVALDGAWLYFTEFGGSAAPDGKLSRVPVSGGAVEVLAKGLDHPLGLTTDASYVYWADYGGGEIERVAK